MHKKTQFKVGLIGNGISPSLTPGMHKSEARALKIDYQYRLIDTSTEEFAKKPLNEILSYAESEQFHGVNVTHPFKIDVVPLMNELSDEVKILGAANTVVFKDNKRIAYNTDYFGFLGSLNESLKNDSIDEVLLLGAGGAGVSVALALLDFGVKCLWIYDRDSKQVELLKAKLNPHHPNKIHLLQSLTDFKLQQVDQFDEKKLKGIVNTTPMGMGNYPGSAIEIEKYSSELWVADIVYFPLETELLKCAKAHGCKIINGSGMARLQAYRSFEFFTSLTANASRFKEHFEEQVKKKTI